MSKNDYIDILACTCSDFPLLEFLKEVWKISWLVLPIGGLIFAAVMAICDIFIDKDKN